MLFGTFAKGKEKRVAFVLANGAYQKDGALKNPRNDAEAMAQALEELAFIVTKEIDLNRNETEKCFSEFESSLDDADVALFYYSGHGVQVDGENYLIPIGAEIAHAYPSASLISIQDLINRISEKVDTRLVILDACRNNPFAAQLRQDAHRAKGLSKLEPTERVRATGGGLAEIDAGPGSFLAFAAAPGQVAYEGAGKISFFTTALLRHIRTYGLEINPLMNRVRSEVLDKTKFKQTPWSNSALTVGFSFKPKSTMPILIPAALSIVSALLCRLQPPFLNYPFGENIFWPQLSIFTWESFKIVGNKVLALSVNPFQGIMFGCVMGTVIWLWGRRTWWSALIVFVVTVATWITVTWIHLQDLQDVIGLIKSVKKSGIEEPVSNTIDKLWERLELALLNLSGAIGAAGVYIGCAVTTRALREISIFALTITVGIAMVWPFYLLGSTNSLILYLTWQASVAACIGYGLSRYVPSAEEVETFRAPFLWFRSILTMLQQKS